MIWAALFIYLSFLLTGSSPIFHGDWLIKDSKKEFKQVIQDKERSKKTMEILDEMIHEAKGFNKEAGKAKKNMEKLIKEYGSTREDFNQLFSNINDNREASTAKILEKLPDLKKNITREEWGNAFKDVQKSQP
jgi:seryl-tRNA synthetase